MSTAKQIAANRLNSQKSTGPRTSEGKAVSSLNALKHGIDAVHQVIFDESAGDLARLAAGYHNKYRSTDPNQRFLVDTLISNEWRLRRLRRVEAGLWAGAANAGPGKPVKAGAVAPRSAFDTKALADIQRIIDSCERNYHRALKELQPSAAPVNPPPSAAASSRLHLVPPRNRKVSLL